MGIVAYKSAFSQLQHTGSLPDHDDLKLESIWNSVAEYYSRTSLTYDSDKWMAVSGIASIYVEKTGRSLVGGLHRDRLIEELGWSGNSQAGRLSIGAPTWSWLSCRSGVRMKTTRPAHLLASLTASPGQAMSECTWHPVYDQLKSGTTKPRYYPITISGHVRSFVYWPLGGNFNKTFHITCFAYTIDSAYLNLDTPLDRNTSILGLVYSFDSPTRVNFQIILLVPASHNSEMFERVGFCRLEARLDDWKKSGDRQRFLEEFGPVKALTIV